MSIKHRVKGVRLKRDHNERKALFKSLLNSLIMHEKIETTGAKAKAIRGVFDKLVTKAKPQTVHVRRLLHAFLGDIKSVNKLIDVLVPRMKDRSSGFTRIVKLGRRRGDDAPVVSMELVDKAVQKEEDTTSKTAPKK